MMINFLNKLFSVENQKTSKGDYIMGRQALSKTTKIRNLFNTGADVTWKSLRNKFDLKSPAAMVGKLRNEGIKQEVRHVWFYEDQIMTQVRYNVKKSKVYRSWTKKTISPFQIGNWRVEIQNKRGNIIGQISFVIKEK